MVPLVAEQQDKAPKTSIIMPVYNHMAMTVRAIEAVRQHTKDYELIVIDNNSTDGLSEWLDEQKDIRVVHVSENLGIPKAKNLGIVLARGEYICFLDNDTEVGEGWLESMLAVFADPTVGFTGRDGYLIDKEHRNFNGSVFTSKAEVDWCGHSVFVFPRRLVKEIGLLIDRGKWCCEDVDQCLRIKKLGYRGKLPDEPVNVVHYGSTTARTIKEGLDAFIPLSNQVWQEWGAFIDGLERGAPAAKTTYQVHDKLYPSRVYLCGTEEVTFKDGRAEVSPEVAYRMSRLPPYEFEVEDKKFPYNPEAWKKERRLIWNANYAAAQGYGMVAENVVTALLALGVNVENPRAISGNVFEGGAIVDRAVERSLKALIRPDCLEVQHCQPPALRFGVVERIWCYTMFESTHTPQSWIDWMNRLEAVLVPSRWLVEAWQAQGLRVPIYVYGHGVDPRYYSYVERPEHEVYTFLHYARLSTRKGTDLVYRAFVDEFAKERDVKLILKNTEPFFPVPPGNPKVEYLSATYTKEQMRELMARADCAVFPSRGEGFFLPGLECMACGLPTIITNWSGPVDYLDPTDSFPLEYKMVPAREMTTIYKEFWAPGEDAGEWAEPSYEHLRYLMRWCYEHRDEAKAKGKRAAQRIANSWTWATKTREFVELIDRLA